MGDRTMFWTVFKADLIFSLCSIGLSVVVTVAIAIWKRRKKKNDPKIQKAEGPRIVIVGGTSLKPEHCPLCGRDWPLPGPVVPVPPAPDVNRSVER